ncbi:hypothetical protein BU24DRAFT_382910 [Aaosphaeria arxii CBS 175.79]|uniref:Uncharacterized protein n=1 Tax=Aaosphaeria arxii CBS 175.79 TaxID=1450172 RepID=A0A6A5Y6H6_9PLEO|nr:uncharacterized protein BU24DRAFT_382910 [Aaosphaeria arxii CBS 175.79]KAF2020899.1 hypothetical protein BU24DRAFT_382910 [Aaosphaeria arxii CBS 175.79]
MARGDAMEAMPMSPRQSPAEYGHAAIAWSRSRRGRMLLLSAAFICLILGLAGARNSETISSSYHALSSSYHLPSWRPHLPNLPSIISSPLKPSNLTIELENGDIEVPSQLKKTTPNFHLLMPASKDDPNFCKTTLSAMILNYPPATTMNLFANYESALDREKAQLKQVLDYLKNKLWVKDEDLILHVDGQDTWFQLPSDVLIRQYQNVLADANKRMLNKYGVDRDGLQKYNETIIFGATKVCEGEDMACSYAPDSLLPSNIYGERTGQEKALTPAKYLDSHMFIGPAKDVRALFEAALKNFDGRHSSLGTAQSVFAAMFGEQQLARDNSMSGSSQSQSASTGTEPKASTWLNWFGGPITTSDERTKRADNAGAEQYEFSIGLDYGHILFQPFSYNAEEELVPLPHDNSTDLSLYHRQGTPTPPLHLPTALERAIPPFWVNDLSSHNPRPQNVKATEIEPLQHHKELDKLEPRDTPWTNIRLVQNTYTGSIPSILRLNRADTDNNQQRQAQDTPDSIPTAKLAWSDLWYAPYARALLRKAFRTPQSPIGFHNAAVGGDNMWDSRGGRGGVWTIADTLWYPWGEVDGVCGKLDQLRQVFDDKKGVWLHETDPDGDKHRVEALAEFEKKVKEAKDKDDKRKKKAEEEERKKKEEEEKKKGGNSRVRRWLV